MHFTVTKSNLLKELNFIQGVVERKSTIPVLSNLLIETESGAIRIKGTDLDVSLTTLCDAEVREPGSICVQAKKLFEIVRALPEYEIEFKWASSQKVAVAPDQVQIICERSRFRMPWIARENFPEIQEFKGTAISLPAELLRTFINRTSFAITNEESRYALNGAKLELSAEGIRMVATDGHRLAYIEKKGKFGIANKIDVIVPRKSLGELAKLCAETEETVEFTHDENHLFFKIGKRLLISRLLSGQFPNYELVLPKENHHAVSIECGRVLGAIKRIMLMAEERSHLIRFELSSDQIKIHAQAPDLGEASEELPVEYSGPPITVGFNAQYLIDFFGVIQDGKVVFEFRDGNSQAQVRPLEDGDYNFRYIIMPMRL